MSDATLFSMSCESAMIKSLVQPPSGFSAYPVYIPEGSLRQIDEVDFCPTWRLDKKNFIPKWCHCSIKWSSKSSFIRSLFVCPFVLYVSQIIEAFLCFSPPLFWKDTTEPQVQRCFLLPFGLRTRQFRLCLIGMELTCRDSRADLAARTFKSFSSSLAQSCFSSGSFESIENEDLVPRLRNGCCTRDSFSLPRTL